ncbi:hypothetical protein AVEN_159311-1 [Araneus ventricosus]|uniref:Uncharacterized protein n=1 Tax=Araneus ventricosus TaxID=182803 RepID=A0A4Y2A0E4_ARAVE|nr:hypothetical protein AVEN_159311-1 [Araneus ventricosus]
MKSWRSNGTAHLGSIYCHKTVMSFSCLFLLVGKRVLQRSLLDIRGGKANAPALGDKLGDHLATRQQFCRLWRQTECSRKWSNYVPISIRNRKMDNLLDDSMRRHAMSRRL